MKKSQNTFKDILQKYKYELNSGDIVAGTIIHHEKCGFLVNIGTNISGYLPQEEVKTELGKNEKKHLMSLQTTRDFFLLAKNLYTQQYVLSIKRLNYIRAWKRIKQIYVEDIIFSLKIKHINKGGVIIYLEGIQGFIPKSHISEDNIKFKIDSNNKIKCKLLRVNENQNQLILSNKSANLALSKHKLKLGEIIYGKIIAIKSYGLFIKIYNINALLHNSEIILKKRLKLEQTLKIGLFIKVKIIYLNRKQGQVSVSIKNLKNLATHHQQ